MLFANIQMFLAELPACLRTGQAHFQENNPLPEAFLSYLKTNLPEPESHRIYFDYGDQTLDALYPPLQKEVDEVMKAKGFTEKTGSPGHFRERITVNRHGASD
ncbi:MAG: hypothetical protein MZV63_05960 [Marinilabiliales bacterium]|nr:hypothetical protein [Marinilabiliales bacterium]